MQLDAEESVQNYLQCSPICMYMYTFMCIDMSREDIDDVVLVGEYTYICIYISTIHIHIYIY
jgi:hypothetical protein